MSEPVRRRPGGPPADRLDQPLAKSRRLTLTRSRMDPESFGEFAERFARFMGTARFLVWMTVFVVVWIASLAAIAIVVAASRNALADVNPFVGNYLAALLWGLCLFVQAALVGNHVRHEAAGYGWD